MARCTSELFMNVLRESSPGVGTMGINFVFFPGNDSGFSHCCVSLLITS